MAARAYIGGVTRQAQSHHITIGILRRTQRSIGIGCRACNKVREVSFANLDLPAALPLASAPRYLNCAACGASNTDTEQPIYLSALE
jgi:hypothetical protein